MDGHGLGVRYVCLVFVRVRRGVASVSVGAGGGVLGAACGVVWVEWVGVWWFVVAVEVGRLPHDSNKRFDFHVTCRRSFSSFLGRLALLPSTVPSCCFVASGCAGFQASAKVQSLVLGM